MIGRYVLDIFPAQMASNAEMFPFDDVIMLRSNHILQKLC